MLELLFLLVSVPGLNLQGSFYEYLHTQTHFGTLWPSESTKIHVHSMGLIYLLQTYV